MQTGRRLRRLRGYAATLLRFASLVRKTKARGVTYIKSEKIDGPFGGEEFEIVLLIYYIFINKY